VEKTYKSRLIEVRHEARGWDFLFGVVFPRTNSLKTLGQALGPWTLKSRQNGSHAVGRLEISSSNRKWSLDVSK